MYGNNIGGPYMMPNNMSYGPMMGNQMMRSAPMIGNAGMMRSAPMMGAGTRGGGLSSLLGLGRGARGATALTGSRSLNLGNLLNSASRALGVVNQAIPIVKEVGPMMNNMRSMLKIASIFKDETDSTSTIATNDNEEKNKTEIVKENTSVKEESSTNENSTTSNSKTNDNEPNFFL